MNEIENATYVSVGRASGFTGLAIFCLMFGLSFDPAFAAQAGGMASLIFAFILVWYALRARTRPYKKTEAWLILKKEFRPPAEIAQQVIGGALRETYYWFAKQAATIAFVLLVIALFLKAAFVYGGLDVLPGASVHGPGPGIAADAPAAGIGAGAGIGTSRHGIFP